MRSDRLFVIALLAGLTGASACSSSSSTGGSGGSGGSPASGGTGGTATGGSGGATTGGSGGTSSGGSGGTSSGGSGGTSPDSGSTVDSGGTPVDAAAAPVDAATAPVDGAASAVDATTGTPGAFALRVTGAEMRANGKFYFKNGQTRDTGHHSPAMQWDAVPEAKSYAISMQDLTGKNYHWVMYDIPPSTTMIPDDMMRTATPDSAEVMGAKNTRFNGNEKYGYFGPGAGCRGYAFIVYALNAPTLPGVTPATGAGAIVSGPLAGMTNVISKTTPVTVTGQSSAAMCP